VKFFQFSSSLLKEFLHNQKKYEINRNLFLKKFVKIIFVSLKSLDLDPDPYIEERAGSGSGSGSVY